MDAAVADAVGDLVTRDQLRAELAVTRDQLRAELATTRDQLTWRLLGGLGALLALFRLSGWLFP